MWDELLVGEKGVTNEFNRYHKRRRFIKTVGRWSWKLKTAKECVITHQPNEVALKMDEANIHELLSHRHSSITDMTSRRMFV